MLMHIYYWMIKQRLKKDLPELRVNKLKWIQMKMEKITQGYIRCCKLESKWKCVISRLPVYYISPKAAEAVETMGQL